MSFEKYIQNWVELDNKLKILNEKSREIRNEKNSLSSNIIAFVETNKLNESSINISDGKLKFAPTKQTTTITLKLIEKCLKDYIDSDELVNDIVTHIKKSRDTKENLEIKRSYNNK